MRIEEYIKDLLFDFDKVIIPGFGAFIGTELFAKIDEDAQKIYPPSKDIVFNDHLKLDDGVLIGKIADERKIRKGIAIQEVQQYVEHISTALQNEKAYAIDGLGTLIKLDGESITFKQDKKVNYLTDAFGLQAIDLPGKIISDNGNTEVFVNKDEVEDTIESSNNIGHAASADVAAAGAATVGLAADSTNEPDVLEETDATATGEEIEVLETIDANLETKQDTIEEEELEEAQEDFLNTDYAVQDGFKTENNAVDFDLNENYTEQETETQIVEPVIEQQPKRFSLWLILLPVLLLLGAGYLLFTLVGSNENPYAKEMAKIENNITTDSKDDKIIGKENSGIDTKNTNSKNQLSNKNTNEPKVDKNITSNTAKPVSKPAKAPAASSAVENAKPGYYVVLASTQNKPQAIKDAEKLRNKNYDAFVIPGPNSYNRVAIFAGTDADAANTNLAEYKKAINASAWILKY